ncbi:MAG: hypothetical protein GX219_04810 [Tissierellia bacterium]|nr:hypothetical protein [Tissierellia bacterium]
MKLIIAIINAHYEVQIHDSLSAKGVSITKLASMGGFREKKSTTLLMGVEDSNVDETIKSIEKICKSEHPLEGDEHGAIVFVVKMNEMFRY